MHSTMRSEQVEWLRVLLLSISPRKLAHQFKKPIAHNRLCKTEVLKLVPVKRHLGIVNILGHRLYWLTAGIYAQYSLMGELSAVSTR
jgi:hypothetical protein